MERIQEQSISAVRSCTLCGSWCAARLCRWPFLSRLPTTSAAWIWHWSNSPSARLATVYSRVTFWQPGLPQGGRARPRPTPHAPYLPSTFQQDMPSLRGVSSLVSPGPSKLTRLVRCAAAAVGGEFVDAAPSQHVKRTASMPGSICRSRVAAPFTAWSALLHHG